MKVLHILPSSHAGGSELCAYETVKVLNAAGYENYVVFPGEGGMVSQLADHLKAYAIIENSWWIAGGKWSLIFKLKMLRGYFLSAFKIRKFIKKHAVDVVITHTLAIPSGMIAARMANVAHIAYIHEYGDIDHGFTFMFGRKKTLKLIDTFSNAVIFNSNTLLTHFKPYFTTARLSVLNSVITYPLKVPATHKKPFSLSVSVVGRISSGKNQQVVIEALALLKKKQITPVVTFVGGTHEVYLDQLNEHIKSNQLERQINFAGHTETPWQYVHNCDVVIVPSKMEAFGRVTIEGMKSGRLVVAADTGAGKELVQHGVNGYLFNPDDASELADILTRIWMMEEIGLVAGNGYQFACSNFNESVHEKQILSILSSVY